VVALYYAFAGGAVALWVPILLRFYKNWLKRHNPISLAICAAVILLIWLAIAGAWVVSGSVRVEIVTFVSTGISALVALYANFTFYWAKRKFNDKREE
jgi:hypothetical protein